MEKIVKTSKKSRHQKYFSKMIASLNKHSRWVKISSMASLLLLVGFSVWLLSSTLKKSQVPTYTNWAKNFIFAQTEDVKSYRGRTNILLLGKGGKGHEAPDLTDTIIFASVSLNDPSVDTISLPRDIWDEELRAKLNSAYYWGNRAGEQGMVYAKNAVEKIVGAPVHYVVVIDFAGFESVIDVLEGIEVDVENSFTDEHYPITGKENDKCDGDPKFKCRYETIEFKQGKQLMDGKTALKFVRSRYAQGDEGTDFARAARQQKVISAVKDKSLSKEILFSAAKIKQLRKIAAASIDTDIQEEVAAFLARKIIDARSSVFSHALPEEMLVNPPISPKHDKLYVFVPAADDWTQVHQWMSDLLY